MQYSGGFKCSDLMWMKRRLKKLGRVVIIDVKRRVGCRIGTDITKK